MTVRDPRIPDPISTAVALAGVVGVLSLAVHDSFAVAGALLGVVLVGAVAGFGGSYWRIGAASGLFVLVAGSGVALVGLRLRAGGTVGLLAGVATAIGIAIGLLTVDGLRPASVRRGDQAAIYGAMALGVWATAVFAVETAGGVGAILSTLVRVGGAGTVGLGVSVGLAAIAIGAAAYAIPPAAVTHPGRLDTYRTNRTRIAIGLAVVAVVLVGAMAVSRSLAPGADVFDGIAGSVVVRGLLVVTIAGGTGVAVVGVVVRGIWSQAGGPPNVGVPMLWGAVVGVGGLVTIAFALGVSTTELTEVLLGGGAVLGLCGGLAWLWDIEPGSDDVGRATLSSTAVGIVAIALAVGGIVTGAGVELDGGVSIGFALEGAAALLLVSTAAFVTDVGRYGRDLGWDIGREGAWPLPQFIRVAWSVAVAAAAFVIAAVGLVVATLFAPVLSAPATMAVVLALGAVLLGTWLLFS